MTGFYDDVYGDVYGSNATAPTPVFSTGRPRVVVQVAVGGAAVLDPSVGAFIVGTSRLGTGTLTSTAWVDVGNAVDLVLSVDIEPAATSQADSATPVRASIVAENYSGTWDPDNPASPYAGGIEVGMPARIVAELDTDLGTVRYGLFRGNVDDITPDYDITPTVTFDCTDALAALGRAQVVPGAVDGDPAGVRLGRILDAAMVPASLRSLDRGISTCQPTTDPDWALSLAQDVVDTELGELWCDGDGVIRFYDRTRLYVAPRSATVQATFSDSGTGVDMTGLAAARRRGEISNQARITRDGDGAVEQVAADAASVARFGPQTYPGSAGTLLRSDADALALAQWIVARFKEPRTRFSAIEVDATGQGMWDVLMPLRRFDRIRAIRNYGPYTVDRELLVEGIRHSITQDDWRIGIATRDIDEFTPFVVGFSRLGTGTLL